MKTNLFQKCFLLTLFLFFLFQVEKLNATTYTAVVSGDWTSALTWGGSAPPTSITSNDIVVVNVGVTVNLDADITINNPLASLNVHGNIEGNKNLSLQSGSISGTGRLVVNELNVSEKGVLLMTGDVICDDFVSTNSLLAVSANLRINGKMTIDGGICQIANAATLTMASDAEINLNNARLTIIGNGLVQGEGNNRIIYTGSSNSTGAETNLDNIVLFRIDFNSDSDQLTCESDLFVEGTIELKKGKINLNGNDLHLNGTISNEGEGVFIGHADTYIYLNGEGNAGSLEFESGSEQLGGLSVGIGKGNEIRLASKLQVNEHLELNSGVLVLNDFNLNLNGHVMCNDTATISGSPSSSLFLKGSGFMGTIVFTEGSEELDTCDLSIQNDGSVELQSNVNIQGALGLNSGKLLTSSANINVASGANIIGGSDSSYVASTGGGQLILNLEADGEAQAFPVGSPEAYFPCWIRQSETADDTRIGVNVISGVYAQGESGTDLSSSQSLVNHSWLIDNYESNSSLDLEMTFQWNQEAEVNGFDRENCYISHFVDGAWDVAASVNATAEANGNFSVSRAGINSLSPFRVADANTTSVENPGWVYKKLNVYPNPTDQYLHFSLDEFQDKTSFSVINLEGKVMLIGSANKSTRVQLDLADLPRGMYVLNINDQINYPFIRL